MDKTLLDLIKKVQPFTKSSPTRLLAMIDAVRRVDNRGIAGDIVECGVWQGGNIILARLLSPDRVCWLYDTFCGMPEPSPLDTKRNGWPAKNGWSANAKTVASRESVVANLRATDVWHDERIRLVEGMVEQTLLVTANLPRAIAVLRLDTDWHSSTKIELEILWPLLAPGGVLIVDDYGHWLGAKKAVDDYFKKKGRPRMHPIDYTAVMIVKP